MRLKVEMTLNAATAQRFKEVAERLASMNLGDDALLAAAVLLRISKSYEQASEVDIQSVPTDGGINENKDQ